MLKKYYPYYFFAGILLLFSFAYPCEKLKFLYNYFEIEKAVDMMIFYIKFLPLLF